MAADEVDRAMVEREVVRLQVKVDRHPVLEAGALPQPIGVSGGMDLPTDELHPAKHHGLDRRIELGNRYGAFKQEDIEVEDPRIVVQLEDAIKMPSQNRFRKERRKKLCQDFRLSLRIASCSDNPRTQ